MKLRYQNVVDTLTRVHFEQPFRSKVVVNNGSGGS